MAPLHFVVGCVCCVRRGDSSGVSCQDSFLPVEGFLGEEGGKSLISGPSGMPGREGHARPTRREQACTLWLPQQPRTDRAYQAGVPRHRGGVWGLCQFIAAMTLLEMTANEPPFLKSIKFLLPSGLDWTFFQNEARGIRHQNITSHLLPFFFPQSPLPISKRHSGRTYK